MNVHLIMCSIIFQKHKNIAVQIYVIQVIKKKAKSAIHAIPNKYITQKQILVIAWRGTTEWNINVKPALRAVENVLIATNITVIRVQLATLFTTFLLLKNIVE